MRRTDKDKPGDDDSGDDLAYTAPPPTKPNPNTPTRKATGITPTPKGITPARRPQEIEIIHSKVPSTILI